ncbi:hypothetical protein [Nocardia cyriacigeorgica]|jgi:hypothetical protein|uniref:hypothetical protein n=1 Tax=Nocardia cyriacigeorgica TaxID=135487 RepID=UPI0002E3B5BC|nr:hypothetical protein [Nocardia cyriacigeorgica]TLF55296.1 hypothetical protein FEK31_21110 [Nocardia cyriacigeorgica]
MAGELNADPEVLIPAAKTAMGLQGNHEGYLKSLMAVQDELSAYVKSPGGGAQIRTSMMEAHSKGSSLAQTLQEIIQVLHDSGVKIDVSDMDAAAQVQRATSFGSDGMNSVSGDVTGAGANQKINVNW